MAKVSVGLVLWWRKNEGHFSFGIEIYKIVNSRKFKMYVFSQIILVYSARVSLITDEELKRENLKH